MKHAGKMAEACLEKGLVDNGSCVKNGNGALGIDGIITVRGHLEEADTANYELIAT